MKNTTQMISIAMVLIMIPWSVFAAAETRPSSQAETWDSFSLAAAVAPDGSIWAAWVIDTGIDREIATSRWDGKSWAPMQVTSNNPGRWDSMPSLAIDAQGVAWLAWSSSTGTDDTLHVSHWTASGWSLPQEVPAWDTVPNRQPVLAAAPRGGLWLAWVGSDGNDDEIYAASWDGSTWSKAQRVSDNDADPAAYDAQPRLAVEPDGTAWVAWTSHQQFLDSEIFAARWDGQRWTPEEQVSSSDGTVAVYPTLAAGNGAVWLAWQDRPTDETTEQRIYARQWTPSGGWDTEMIVSSAPESAVAEELPSLVLDDQGRPHVSWHVEDGNMGVGYAMFDGSAWSPPHWLIQDTVAESETLLVDGQPLLLWWPADAMGHSPLLLQVQERALPQLPLLDTSTQSPESTLLVKDRHLAFGDSITWGMYNDPATGLPVGDYPARLEELLDHRVTPSEVINDGLSGERTNHGRWRLLDGSFPTYLPQFIELMEGTNDISANKPYDAIVFDLSDMVKWTKKAGAVPLLGTLIPRRDDLNDETDTMNGYLAELATNRGVPLVDNWQAFYDYGNWRALFIDIVHPNAQGMAVLANSWYSGLLDSIWWLTEDTEPPNTWIESLPAESECGQVPVSWNGIDNLSWVVDYDVQVHRGTWTNWLLGTPATNAIYSNGSTGETISFRVRGRDLLGNLSAYSAARSTTLVDNRPPYRAEVAALPPARQAPFEVRWSGADACDSQLHFDVKYCIGSACTGPSGTWIPWLTSTLNTSASFSPEPPDYGEGYYFRVRAYDSEGLWVDSAPVSTRLARFTVRGEVFTVRHEGILNPTVVATNTLFVEPWDGTGYTAYVADVGEVDLAASHVRFGPLPPMRAVSVTTDLSGIDLVLPPHDDVVQDGGFEGGIWGNWVPGGSQPPELSGEPHTGDGATRLGDVGQVSTLSQSLAIPSGLTNPTLSFLVRLDDAGGGSSTLQVQLANTSISHTQAVSSGDWVHVWIPVEAALGKNISLVFSVSDNPAVRLDEVSLGSALHGVAIYLPIVTHASAP